MQFVFFPNMHICLLPILLSAGYIHSINTVPRWTPSVSVFGVDTFAQIWLYICWSMIFMVITFIWPVSIFNHTLFCINFLLHMPRDDKGNFDLVMNTLDIVDSILYTGISIVPWVNNHTMLVLGTAINLIPWN